MKTIKLINKNSLHCSLCGLLLLSIMLMAPLAKAEGSWGIDQLMQSLATTRSSHASFIEKKSIAILEKPVESSGELFYSAPDHLEKRTLKPKAESMLLDKDKLIVEQRGKKHVLALRNYPEIAAFIDSIRGTLAGDRQALERNYHLSMDGNEQSWNLTLIPIEDKMKKVVAKISIAGLGNALQTIDILQADGDSSQMSITPLPVLE
ncbi:MAG: outer membrane lipoprotein carrier protein LolA [Methylotenera sp.]|uniref:LolA-related protein n=1 Tax=Methylotenera sp. TaxID=2051956 RepID=UPI002489EADE|nr:LolA-related protein [Methylotenera sp.]MDI1308693.1 outer membrane lipoprotein carrier protein LolA [Methylotenera sp.]